MSHWVRVESISENSKTFTMYRSLYLYFVFKYWCKLNEKCHKMGLFSSRPIRQQTLNSLAHLPLMPWLIHHRFTWALIKLIPLKQNWLYYCYWSYVLFLFQPKRDLSKLVINLPQTVLDLWPIGPQLTFTYYINTACNVHEVIYWHLPCLVSFIINSATLIFSVTSVNVQILVGGL